MAVRLLFLLFVVILVAFSYISLLNDQHVPFYYSATRQIEITRQPAGDPRLLPRGGDGHPGDAGQGRDRGVAELAGAPGEAAPGRRAGTGGQGGGTGAAGNAPGGGQGADAQPCRQPGRPGGARAPRDRAGGARQSPRGGESPHPDEADRSVGPLGVLPAGGPVSGDERPRGRAGDAEGRRGDGRGESPRLGGDPGHPPGARRDGPGVQRAEETHEASGEGRFPRRAGDVPLPPVREGPCPPRAGEGGRRRAAAPGRDQGRPVLLRGLRRPLRAPSDARASTMRRRPSCRGSARRAIPSSSSSSRTSAWRRSAPRR